MTETKVAWFPWDKKAFHKAKELDRPILLAISAVWCHWCHVMDQTTYSDRDVAKLIEEKLFLEARKRAENVLKHIAKEVTTS